MLSAPIAVKYALVSGLLLTTFLVILGVFSYQTGVRGVDEKTNQEGIALVQMAASLVDPYWHGATALTGDAKAQARRRLETKLKQFVAANDEVFEILVYPGSEDGDYEVSATGRRTIKVTAETVENQAADAAGIKIGIGLAREITRVRFYVKPLPNGAGTIQLFLSLDAVEQTRSRFLDTTIVVVFVATLVGIGVSILLGRFLTRPIRILKQDMMVVAGGDLQHKSRIATGDELEALARTFNRMTEHLADAQEQQVVQKSLERELSIASDIQAALLPDQIPQIAGYEIATHYESAKEVGGDYYDFIPLGSTRLGIVVADVSGKGIPGSLVMTMTRSLMRMAARESRDPAEILGRVNSSLSQDMTRGMFVTLIFADFNAMSGRVRIARAGHNPAYLYRVSADKLLQIQPEGIALGMDRGERFESILRVQEFRLEPGDLLALYTDGIIEAMDPNGAEYTPERFARVLTAFHGESAQTVVNEVMHDLAKHTKGGEPSDDITLLILKRAAT